MMKSIALAGATAALVIASIAVAQTDNGGLGGTARQGAAAVGDAAKGAASTVGNAAKGAASAVGDAATSASQSGDDASATTAGDTGAGKMGERG
jgi:hypothetical protein